MERLRFLWDKLKEFDVLFDDYMQRDFETFLSNFLVSVDGEIQASGLMYDVDDVGIFRVTDIIPTVSCSVHFTFWDKIFTGREGLCRAGIQYLFNNFYFQRIEARIGLYATAAMGAVERIGFVKEGRLRKTRFYKGEWFDSNVYSMIPEDLIGTPRHFTQVCYECGGKARRGHMRRVS